MPHHAWPGRPLLVCEGKELLGKLTRHVAVQSHQVRDPETVKNREQQQRIFRMFSERLGLLDQQVSPLHGRPGFRRGVAADMKKRGYERNLKLDFLVTKGRRRAQGGDLVERAPE